MCFFFTGSGGGALLFARAYMEQFFDACWRYRTLCATSFRPPYPVTAKLPLTSMGAGRALLYLLRLPSQQPVVLAHLLPLLLQL